MLRMRVSILAVLCALGLAIVPADGDAQVRRGRGGDPLPTWAPIAVGLRAGWDQRANAEVLGAHIRIPVVRSGILEFVPNAEIAFLSGAKDYQYTLETAWVPGGPRGGVFVSAGIGWRDTVVASATSGRPRDTFFGYVLGAGGKTRVGRVEVEVALRWVFLNDTTYRPNAATFGINYPLWQIGPGAGE
ncbi:MAG: hypothetical protein OEN56_01480 [Gemmatimonadota bacterium]|nr:hypothetical protein [Gemmatimonadota bacterium]